MTKRRYETHSVTEATRLKNALRLAGDSPALFGINVDVYIESTLSESTIDQVVIDAGS